MLPAKARKVDISSLNEEEKKLFRLYGKLPTHKNVLTKMQKDRKFFDSGDYALSKAGKAPSADVGTAIPSPENIPHATSPPVHQQLSVSPTNSIVNANAPVKESPLVEPKSVGVIEPKAVDSAEPAEDGVTQPVNAMEGDTIETTEPDTESA